MNTAEQRNQFSILDKDQLLHRGVIKAKRLKDAEIAKSIITQAEEQAKKIRLDAKRMYEWEKQRGYANGVAQAKQETTETILSTVSMCSTYVNRLEQSLAGVVKEAVKKIISDFDNDELLFNSIQNSLNQLLNNQRVTIRVAPNLVAPLNKRIDTTLPNPGLIDVVADISLKDTDCILESAIGTVNAGIDRQIESIERALTLKP